MFASRRTRIAAGSDQATFTTKEPPTVAVPEHHSGFDVLNSVAGSMSAPASAGTADATASRIERSDESGSHSTLTEPSD
jgi:hypothetical protein